MPSCDHKRFKVKSMSSKCDNKEDWFGTCPDCDKDITLKGVSIIGLESYEPVDIIVKAEYTYDRVEEHETFKCLSCDNRVSLEGTECNQCYIG